MLSIIKVIGQNAPQSRKKMPHIDLRQAFSSSDQSASTISEAAAREHRAVAKSPFGIGNLAKFAFAGRFSSSEWTNIFFVTVTSLGGLFCAFYFFNGAELLRAAAAWPREFLYPRPPAAEKQKKINRPTLPGEETGPFAETYRFSLTPTGNPSSRTANWPNSNPVLPGASNVPATGSFPAGGSRSNPGSLLGQLNLLPPGGDALVQALFQGAARTADLDARRTVVVITTPVSRTRQAANARIKNATNTTARTVTTAATQVSTSGSQTRVANSPTGVATRLQPISAVRPSTNIPQSLTGAGRGFSSSSMSRVGSMSSRVGSIGRGRR